MLIYIRLINKPWHLPDLLEVPHQHTSQKTEVELEKTARANLRKTKITSNIRNIQQVYYLERQWFS